MSSDITIQSALSTLQNETDLLPRKEALSVLKSFYADTPTSSSLDAQLYLKDVGLVLSNVLSDFQPDVTISTVEFLSTLLGWYSSHPSKDDVSKPIDSVFQTLFPIMLKSLGSSSKPIREMINCLCGKYVSITENLQSFMSVILDYGIESGDWKTRRENIRLLNSIMEEQKDNGLDYLPVMSCYIAKLRDVSDDVVEASIAGLTSIKSILGEDGFVVAISKLSRVSRGIFKQFHQKILGSREDSLASKTSSFDSIGTPSLNPPKLANASTNEVDDARIPTGPEKVPSFSRVSATRKQIPASFELRFLPAYVITDVSNQSDWKVRANGIETLYQLSVSTSVDNIIPDFSEFLRLTRILLQDEHFKIVLTTLQTLAELLVKLDKKCTVFKEDILTTLLPRLADNKVIVRQLCTKILIKLTSLTSMKVVQDCIRLNTSDHLRVKEELINFISTALLTFQDEMQHWDFSLDETLGYILSGLHHDKAKIKYVAVEACAILASQMGSPQLMSKLESHACGLDSKLVDLLSARFADPILPQLNDDGILEHIISRTSSTTRRPDISISPTRDSISNLPSSPVRVSSFATPTRDRSKSGIDWESVASTGSRAPSVVAHKRISNATMDTKPPSRTSKTYPPLVQSPVEEVVKETNLSSKIDSDVLAKRRPQSAEQEIAAPETSSPTGHMERRSSRRRASLPITTNVSKQISMTPKEREEEIRLTEQDLHQMLEDIVSNKDWSLTTQHVEKMILSVPQYPNIFVAAGHELSLALIAVIQNLRSTVAKSGLQCLKLVLDTIPKAIDSDFEIVLGSLLKKIGEGNAFMIEEVDKCLAVMSDVGPVHKLFSGLLTNADHKHTSVRQRVAHMLEKLFLKMNKAQVGKILSSLREMERLCPVLLRLIGEGNADTRNAAKRAAVAFASSATDFEKAIHRVLSARQTDELMEIVRSGSNMTGNEDSPIRSSATKQQSSQGKYSQGQDKKRRSLVKQDSASMYDSQMLLNLVETINSVDWKTRLSGIEQAVDVIKSSYHANVLDALAERCRDGNSKVALLALQSINDIVPVLGSKLDALMPTIIQIVSNQLVASNASLKVHANTVIENLIQHSDIAIVSQNLTTIVQHGSNLKVKGVLIDKLKLAAKRAHEVKPQVISKYIIPCSLKMMNESKSEIKKGNLELLRALYSFLGEDIYSFVQPESPQALALWKALQTETSSRK